MKKVLKFVLVLFLFVVLVGCKKEEAFKAVENLIDNIGEVTLEDEALINEIEEKFNALSEEDQEKVANLAVLIDAQVTLDSLKFLAELDINYDDATLAVLTALKGKINNLSNDVANKIQNEINAALDKINKHIKNLEFEAAVLALNGEVDKEALAQLDLVYESITEEFKAKLKADIKQTYFTLSAQAKEQGEERMKLKLGIDRIDEHLDLFNGKRVGLITNPTGINSKYQSTIDVLNEKINLVALFSPEHGVRGNLQAGVNLGTYVDEETGITVYSLYGDTRKPTKEMLDEIDVLCIDIQDVGARFYTYVYTMAYSMMACKEEGKKFVVFDRPNPINASDYEGNILDINYRSFIGYYPTIQRHGMTIGELAYLFNEEFEIGCDLEVIKMANYDRTKYLDELDILYVYPSPNLPTVNSCILYPGTCIFEGTNLSEGRGTATPFELIGAPYINSKELADKLNSMNIEGVYFRPQYFTPIYSKNKDLLCGGVYIHVLDRKKLKSVSLGFILLDTIRNLYPNDFKVNPPWSEGGRTMLDLNTGTDKISKYLLTLEEQLAWIKEDTKKFGEIRSKYLIY